MNIKCYKCKNEFDGRFESTVTLKVMENSSHYIYCPNCVEIIDKIKLFIENSTNLFVEPVKNVDDSKINTQPEVPTQQVPQKIGAPVGNVVSTGKGNWFAGTSWG